MWPDLQLWQFIASQLDIGEPVMLLIVAASSGSSPGRAGYKMAVASDRSLTGSIGGGVMEVALVERARAALSEPPALAGGLTSLSEQEHKKKTPHPSGMICSGKQTVIVQLLTADASATVNSIIKSFENEDPLTLTITQSGLGVTAPTTNNFTFVKHSETDFTYTEKLGPKNELYIIGGGHCSLALSELMSKMDFRISIFDDRPDLNTIAKNRFADEIRIIDSYQDIGGLVPSGPGVYVVVMTLGYKFDEIVIRSLFDREFKYFGVLGSRAKMKTLITALKKEGLSDAKLARIRTPIGLPINSHTPIEIAVSIAAEIIAVKNARGT